MMFFVPYPPIDDTVSNLLEARVKPTGSLHYRTSDYSVHEIVLPEERYDKTMEGGLTGFTAEVESRLEVMSCVHSPWSYASVVFVARYTNSG